VFGRQTLMDLTRGRAWEAFDRTIDAQISRLRKKVEDDPPVRADQIGARGRLCLYGKVDG